MWESWISIEFEDLNLLLAGSHEDHPYQFLQTIWIADKANCFRLNSNVSAKKNIKKVNPRLIGEIIFKENAKKVGDNLASEVIRCKGIFNCKLDDKHQCSVKMKIVYMKGNKVELFLSSSNHGIHFKPALKQLRISQQVRLQIKENDSKMNALGTYGTTPAIGEMFSTTFIYRQFLINFYY